MRLGVGLTTGVNVRLDASAIRGRKPVLPIGCNVHTNDALHTGAIELVVIGDHVLIASRVFFSNHHRGNNQIQDAAFALGIPPAVGPFLSTNTHLAQCVARRTGLRDIPPNSIAAGNSARVQRVFATSTRSWRRS